MVTGEVTSNWALGMPFCTPVFMSTAPFTPKPAVGFPVSAFSENRRPSVVHFVGPHFVSSLGIESDNGPVWGGHVQLAVHYDRRSLRRASAAAPASGSRRRRSRPVFFQ